MLGGATMWAFLRLQEMNEALMELVILRTRYTPYPELIECDAKRKPQVFMKGK